MWRFLRAVIVIVLILLALPYLIVPFYRSEQRQFAKIVE